MKKLLIAASLLIGMIAGAMVLSSFSEPQREIRKEKEQITMNERWTKIGEYKGKGPSSYETFVIWQKEGMCNSYYWVNVLHDYRDCCYTNPDEACSTTGVLMKDRDDNWYAALYGDKYIIDF